MRHDGNRRVRHIRKQAFKGSDQIQNKLEKTNYKEEHFKSSQKLAKSKHLFFQKE